ncbi:hypothetical protein BDZ89DRAFT_1122177 [Hymenopellis radicata]|nr:hypothetical protein BDZ89DRAFT_1122177 [Hymenopellis radicata]
MVKHKSISTWINVDGEALAEYGEEVVHAEDKVVCWIPSEAGKEFSVHVRHENSTVQTATYVYVDGNFLKGLIMDPWSRTPKDTVSIHGMPTSAMTERNLMFAGLQLSDDDGLLGAAVSAELGEIKIEHWHVMVGERVAYRTNTYAETGPIHERSKKAVSHRAQLGPQKVVATQTQRNVTKVACLLTVIYRYRPLDMLQANGIAPPPAQASSSRKRNIPLDEDVINISDEESEDEPQRIAKLEAELQRLRNGSKSSKKIKSEPVVKKEKRQKIVFDPNDVIDLTYRLQCIALLPSEKTLTKSNCKPLGSTTTSCPGKLAVGLLGVGAGAGAATGI